MEGLCELIGMQREDLHWWDDLDVPAELKETEPHLKGTSAVQFIKTSSIVIHTLDLLKAAYINVFSCKDFDAEKAAGFSAQYFGGHVSTKEVVVRK